LKKENREMVENKENRVEPRRKKKDKRKDKDEFLCK
jgi:hypothetical protein